MRVYDLVRSIEFARTLKDVAPSQIGIAARGEMASIALFSSLLDGKCKILILQAPPETLDVASSPDGRGEALEMLNVLQITDVNQLPALISPARTYIVGKLPEAYQWSVKTLDQLDQNNKMVSISQVSEIM